MALGKVVGTFEGKSDTPACTGSGEFKDITYTTNVSLKVSGEIGNGIGCWTQVAPTLTTDRIYPIKYFGLLTFMLPSGGFTKEKIQGWGTCEDSKAIATWKYCSVFMIGGRSYGWSIGGTVKRNRCVAISTSGTWLTRGPTRNSAVLNSGPSSVCPERGRKD